ncbi:MAG: leucine-rich repeat protein, partial [Clostridiales bacterium]|nr:leucine-rich repeat protein [Clostridiales bacterium]
MKKLFKTVSALAVCMILLAMTLVPAAAQGEYGVSVNGGSVFEGSSVSAAVALAGFSGLESDITSLSVNGNLSGQTGYIKSMSGLSSLTISGSSVIPNAAFSGMTSLRSVSLSSVQTISAAAFNGCSSLSSVSLGGVRTIY